MAHIVKRKNSYAVVYNTKTEDGKRKQKWETYHSEKEAYERKHEIENPNLLLGIRPRLRTMDELLDEYTELHGQVRWAVSTYTENVRLMKNYIRPHLGDIRIKQINRNLMSRYFQKLQILPRVSNKYKPNDIGIVGRSTVYEIQKLLRSVFQQAIYWGHMDINPVDHIQILSSKDNYKSMLSADQVLQVINGAVAAGNIRLALIIQLAFVCSMRIGEIHGVSWKDVDLQKGSIHVKRELCRVGVEALRKLNYKDVYHAFCPRSEENKTRLVLKHPKTHSSIRIIYLPESLTRALYLWKAEQGKNKSNWEKVYQDLDLVITQTNGRPYCMKQTSTSFKALLCDLQFPAEYFHSLRYSSTSYKLILSGGDIKAVQGDTGHSQPDMVLSVYALIQSEQRVKLAGQMEENFCLQVSDLGSKE